MFATLRAKGTTDNFSKVFVSAPSYFSPEYSALERFATTASGAEAAADLRVALGSSWIQRDKPKNRQAIRLHTGARNALWGEYDSRREYLGSRTSGDTLPGVQKNVPSGRCERPPRAGILLYRNNEGRKARR